MRKRRPPRRRQSSPILQRIWNTSDLIEEQSDQTQRIRSQFPHHSRKLQAAKTIGVVIQLLPIVIVMALQEHDLLGQYFHDLLLLLKCRRHLAKKIVVIFQGSPLGQHLLLQLPDLPSMVVLQLPILLSGLPQRLDVGQQLGTNGGSVVVLNESSNRLDFSGGISGLNNPLISNSFNILQQERSVPLTCTRHQ
jgi:hypothetical protein